jgi:hypothetical protein
LAVKHEIREIFRKISSTGPNAVKEAQIERHQPYLAHQAALDPVGAHGLQADLLAVGGRFALDELGDRVAGADRLAGDISIVESTSPRRSSK